MRTERWVQILRPSLQPQEEHLDPVLLPLRRISIRRVFQAIWQVKSRFASFRWRRRGERIIDDSGAFLRVHGNGRDAGVASEAIWTGAETWNSEQT